MDSICHCAMNFIKLKNYEYKFVVSRNFKEQIIMLNFKDVDFFHLAGLHYLKDISIPRNREKTINSVIHKKTITDSLIMKSKIYQNPTPDLNIKARIEELSVLEEYLDDDNLIRIYQNNKNHGSAIDADYFIESKAKGNIVYIFIKKRDDNSGYYRVNSIFRKGSYVYNGTNLYWMLKEKIGLGREKILFKHKDYKIP